MTVRIQSQLAVGQLGYDPLIDVSVTRVHVFAATAEEGSELSAGDFAERIKTVAFHPFGQIQLNRNIDIAARVRGDARLIGEAG
ncbi:hypothetical protein D3C74_452440 [compost metagenome]